MSEWLNPESDVRLDDYSARQMGEMLFTLWSDPSASPLAPVKRSHEEIAEMRRALSQGSYAGEAYELDYERAGNFTRALIGVEPPPTYVIDQHKIDQAMGPGSGKQGFRYWFKQLTGETWDDMQRGYYIPRLDTTVVYAPASDRAHLFAHENVHRGGIVLSKLFNEGFATLVQYLYEYPVPLRQDWKEPPMGHHGLGLFTVAALCDKYPELFDKMAAVVREPSLQSYGDLVEGLYDATGITSADFVQILALDVNDTWNEYPEVLRKMIPEAYFHEDELPLWNLAPKILDKLEAYEKMTGYRDAQRNWGLGLKERAFSKGPSHPEAGYKLAGEAAPEVPSNDDVTAHIWKVIRTMGGAAQTGVLE